MEVSIRGDLDELNIDIVHEHPSKVPPTSKDATYTLVDEMTHKYLTAVLKLLGEKVLYTQVDFCGFLTFKHPECCICLMACDEEEVCQTKCDCKSVFYHPACLKTWLAKDDRCPTCRKKVSQTGWSLVTAASMRRNEAHSEFDLRDNLPAPKTSSEGFRYCCDGSHHKRKSKYKTAVPALKHLRDKHHIPIVYHGVRSGWGCHITPCTGRNFGNGEILIQHLVDDHHLKDIEML
jgi:hypothetical protein